MGIIINVAVLEIHMERKHEKKDMGIGIRGCQITHGKDPSGGEG